jgi:hypothetical protein
MPGILSIKGKYFSCREGYDADKDYDRVDDDDSCAHLRRRCKICGYNGIVTPFSEEECCKSGSTWICIIYRIRT